MLIGGLQKTTLIDFPNRVACTVFTIGCNWRCPFCHNKDLVTLNLFKKSGNDIIKESTFFKFLAKRKKILDGVCITGGEPTLQSDLPEFCKHIKKIGFQVKLDTNGSNPEVLEELIKNKLIDFVAMDVKTAFDGYQKVVNSKYQIAKIKNSIKLILKSDLEYEFRTTVVPGIHTKKVMKNLALDLTQIAQSLSIKHQSLTYVLQPFRPQNCLDPRFLQVKPFSNQEIQNILKSVQKILPKTRLRGEN